MGLKNTDRLIGPRRGPATDARPEPTPEQPGGDGDPGPTSGEGQRGSGRGPGLGEGRAKGREGREGREGTDGPGRRRRTRVSEAVAARGASGSASRRFPSAAGEGSCDCRPRPRGRGRGAAALCGGGEETRRSRAAWVARRLSRSPARVAPPARPHFPARRPAAPQGAPRASGAREALGGGRDPAWTPAALRPVASRAARPHRPPGPWGRRPLPRPRAGPTLPLRRPPR